MGNYEGQDEESVEGESLVSEEEKSDKESIDDE